MKVLDFSAAPVNLYSILTDSEGSVWLIVVIIRATFSSTSAGKRPDFG